MCPVSFPVLFPTRCQLQHIGNMSPWEGSIPATSLSSWMPQQTLLHPRLASLIVPFRFFPAHFLEGGRPPCVLCEYSMLSRGLRADKSTVLHLNSDLLSIICHPNIASQNFSSLCRRPSSKHSHPSFCHSSPKLLHSLCCFPWFLCIIYCKPLPVCGHPLSASGTICHEAGLFTPREGQVVLRCVPGEGSRFSRKDWSSL